MSEVAVVVPNYNGRGFLLDCLRAVEAQSVPATQIVVVDNASTDGSVDEVERALPGVRVVRNRRNLGFAGGANAGVRATSTPLVAVLNSDARPRRDWLERLLSVAARDEPDVWAWGSVLVDPTTGLVESAGDEWSPRGFAFKRQRGERVEQLPVEPFETFAPPGAAPLLRRDVFDALGGYHERFFLYYEDVDLAHRARRAGFRALMVPGARVEHDLGRSGTSHRTRYFVARNSLWCTVRNAEELEPRMWWSVTKSDWHHATRGAYRGPYARGRLAALAGLPMTLRERRRLRQQLAGITPPTRSLP